MPRYYCDYCDTYLTHDSPSVRKQHNAGYKHKANVREYYQSFEQQQTQILIDQKIKEHLGQAAAYQQVGVLYNQHLASFPARLRPRLPVLPPPSGAVPVLPPPSGAVPVLPPSSGITPLPLAPGVRLPVIPRPLATTVPGYGNPSPPVIAAGPPPVNAPTTAPGEVAPPSSTAATPPQVMYNLNPTTNSNNTAAVPLPCTTGGRYAYGQVLGSTN